MHIANKLIDVHCHKDKIRLSSTIWETIKSTRRIVEVELTGLVNVSFSVNCQPSETDKNNIHGGE